MRLDQITLGLGKKKLYLQLHQSWSLTNVEFIVGELIDILSWSRTGVQPVSPSDNSSDIVGYEENMSENSAGKIRLQHI